jgi:hypothetical protein
MQCRSDLARFQNAFGIDSGTLTPSQHPFVARPLALVDEARANPPHERVKPEQRRDNELDRRQQIVATDDVTDLMRDDRFDMRCD